MAGYDPDAEHAQTQKPALKPKASEPKPKQAEQAATTAVAKSSSAVEYSQEEYTHRDGFVGQLQQIASRALYFVNEGKVAAIQALMKHDIPRRSEIWTLLSIAAGAALGAATGGVATLVVTDLVAIAEAKMIGTLVNKAVTAAVPHDLGPSGWRPDNLIEGYERELDVRIGGMTERFDGTWASVHDALHRLPTSTLKVAAACAAASEHAVAAKTLAKRHFLVGWTNFLARAMHGAMHWDPWQSAANDGSVKLQGARDPWTEPAATRSDPTTDNVDPKGMGWALERTQRPMMEEHYGILEIFLDSNGRLLEIPDYGMRLDNVGPNVRMELRQMGKVRDLKVNKVVRMCSYRHDGIEVDPPAPIASILITADGYVRAHDWARFMRVHVEESATRKPWDIKGDFGRCMDQLIWGQETKNCHVDHARENAEIAAFAEHAQGLSLSHLKV